MLKIKINDHEFQADTFVNLIENIHKHQSDESVSEFCKALQTYLVCEFDKRICSHCGNPMTQGYCIGDGDEYYCSDECLHAHYTEKEYKDLWEIDEGYWTEWEN